MAEKKTREPLKIEGKNERWMIGVGASAGGLEALTVFVANLPKDFSHPVMIAQHLAPHAKSMMVELLSRHSQLPVVAAGDKDPIEAGKIYIIPPNHDAEITDDRVVLTMASKATRPKPSINSFFESLARSYGKHAVGIILSGTGSDGAEGIEAIRSVGGITLAQDDRSAKYDGMPKAAVNSGSVDSILPPDQMARNLLGIISEHMSRLRVALLDADGIQKILELIKELNGNDFRRYKMSTIQRRLAKRMVHVGISSFEDYFSRLRSDPQEVTLLVQELLISVTSFFRDPEVYEAVVPVISRIIGGKKTGEEVRVWSAACATGEEAYSLAILFLECAEKLKKHALIKVFATDLDQDALLEARGGLYTAKEVESVPDEFLAKYFVRRDGKFEVTKRLRDLVVFARQDLVQNPPFVKVDFVSCRNVLIYFDADLQRSVLETIHYSLVTNGVLLLGKSESANALPELYGTVDRVAKIYTRLEDPTRKISMPRLPKVLPFQNSPMGRRPAPGPSLAEASYLRLIKAYGIAGCTVDEEGNILQMIGDVSAYLGFHSPNVDFRIGSLLPPGVGVEIPLLIRKAAKDGEVQKSRAYKKAKSKNESYNILIRPLADEFPSPDGRSLFLINFEDRKKVAVEEISHTPTDLNPRVSELEQELFVTREHLQTVVEELGVSNEELQSLNEELSSTNEELQSSTEELETTNEELQSTNEELTTLNEEVTIKSAELRYVNVSFENVQNSIGAPLIILDDKERIVRYNPESLKLFALSAGDIGRDISRVSSNFENVNFSRSIREAIQDEKSTETVIEVGSAVFQMRILPCFDENRKITGAILIFIDNTKLIRTQETLSVSETRMRSVIDSSASIIFLKDTLGRYLLVNESFSTFFGLNEKEVLGKTDREIFPDSIAVPFRALDLEVFVKRVSMREQETILKPDGTKHYFLSSRFPLFDPTGANPYAVGTVAVDITPQIRAQEQLHESENRYRALVEDQAVFVCRHGRDGKLSYVNSPLATYFGGTVDTYVGHPFENLIFEADRAMVSQDLMLITKSQPVAQFEHRIPNSVGGIKWVKWISRGIFNPGGEVMEFQSVGFDVTESRNRTDALIEKDTFFSNIFNYTVDFLSVFKVVDGEFILESFNNSAARALGKAYGQLIGRNLRDFVDPGQAETSLEHYRICAKEKRAEIFDEHLEFPGTLRYFSTTLIPIPGRNGDIERIAAMSRDITSHKKVEFDLRKAKEEADVANRSKSEFLATMSHELRTPLNVLIGMSHLLSDTTLDQDQRAFVGSIHRSGNVLLALIEDLLDMSKIEAGKIKLDNIAFSVQSIVNEIEEIFQVPARQKGILLRVQHSGPIAATVNGDPARLRQVLTNLVGNAIKFTDKGHVELKITVTAEPHSDLLEYAVSVLDSGIGIAVQDQARLFQKFSQVNATHSRKYGGTGLGLMISKQLVTLMGGDIGYESLVGAGSHFWFKVKFRKSAIQFLNVPETKPAPIAQPSEKSSPSLTVLAVDDNADSRVLIGLLLKKLGHQAVMASGGADAIANLESKKIDLVLMDIQMPDMDGFEATGRIRNLSEDLRKVPVIALTANAMAGDSERAFESGMDDYLTKPINIESLRSMLDKWAQSTNRQSSAQPRDSMRNP